MNFFIYDLKKVVIILFVLAIIFLSIFFFAFVALIIFPVIFIIYLIRKFFFLSYKNELRKKNNYNFSSEENNGFIDVDFKKNEEKDI